MSVTMRQMLEAGVHFGHQTRYWNPKMAEYIFGQRNKIHIVNLEKTMQLYQEAMKFIRQLARTRARSCSSAPSARRARSSPRKPAAAACPTSTPAGWRHAHQLQDRQGVDKRLKDLEQMQHGRHVREAQQARALTLQREMDKLNKSLGGIKDMNGLPDALFVIDVGYHKIAITEAMKLGIPIVAVVDTNHRRSASRT
jgi:small subunit ribosomal protein S2